MKKLSLSFVLFLSLGLGACAHHRHGGCGHHAKPACCGSECKMDHKGHGAGCSGECKMDSKKTEETKKEEVKK